MLGTLFSITYEDKHAAALVFKKMKDSYQELGIVSLGLEKNQTKSKRTRSHLRLLVGLSAEISPNLPSILRSVQNSLKDHPLHPHLSFDFHISPISNDNWNFDSYDNVDYQKIFISKRKASI